MTKWAKVEHKQLSHGETQGMSQLLSSLEAVLAKNVEVRQNGAVSSERTRQAHVTVLTGVCKRLYDLGFQLKSINALEDRHLRVLMPDYYSHGLKPITLMNYISVIRRLSVWIKKPNLVPATDALEYYLPMVDKKLLKVKTYTESSKSWTENGIDVAQRILEADGIDRRFGAMLRLGLAFGLRRKEQLKCKPTEIDGGSRVMIRGSVAKSGRSRDIVIYDGFQRFCLDHAKKVAGKGCTLGWPDLTFQQSINRYNYLMRRKLGISGANSDCVGHGLRAEFFENLLLRLGFVPPTLGGSMDQLTKSQFKVIGLNAMEQGGHGRLKPITHYTGPISGKTRMIGKVVGTILVSDSLIAQIYMSPVPKVGAENQPIPLSTRQLANTTVHVMLLKEGLAHEIGLWKVEHPDHLAAGMTEVGEEARSKFKEKAGVILSSLGWFASITRP